MNVIVRGNKLYREDDDREIENYQSFTVKQEKGKARADITISFDGAIIRATGTVEEVSGTANITGPAFALAEENGVDLSKVTPTGANGGILKSDVEDYIKSQEAAADSGTPED